MSNVCVPPDIVCSERAFFRIHSVTMDMHMAPAIYDYVIPCYDLSCTSEISNFQNQLPAVVA